MKLGLGELVSRIATTNLRLWEAQDWVYKAVAMTPDEFAALPPTETQEHLRELARFNLDRNKEMTAIDEVMAEVFARPREGKWVLGYSQFGEHDDIDEAIKGMTTGYAVEVGASNGVIASNTKHLEDRGWKVLAIEANPYWEADLRASRKNVMIVACGAQNDDAAEFLIYENGVNGSQDAYSRLKTDRHSPTYDGVEPVGSITVPVRTLDYCLETVGFPRVDVVSIDVEGGETEVLDGFDLARWQPKIVILEDWKAGVHRKRMEAAGYTFKHRRGVNEVFIRG